MGSQIRVRNPQKHFRIEKNSYTIQGNKVLSRDAVVGKYDQKKEEIRLQGDKRIYRLNPMGQKVLDITNEDRGLLTIKKEDGEFDFLSNRFVVQKYSNDQTIQDVQNQTMIEIKRDDEGNIERILDRGGKEVRAIEYRGVAYPISYGIYEKRIGDMTLSPVGEIIDSEYEGRTAQIDEGKTTISQNTNYPQFFSSWLRRNEVRIELPKAILDKREELEELERSIAKINENKDPRDIQKNTIDKLPKEFLQIDMVTHFRDVGGYKQEYQNKISTLAGVEAGIWLEKANASIDTLQRIIAKNNIMQGIGEPRIRLYGKKISQIVEKKIELQIEISKINEEICKKIREHEDTEQAAKILQKKLDKHRQLDLEGRVTSIVAESLNNLFLASKRYDLGVLRKELEKKIESPLKKMSKYKLGKREFEMMQIMLIATNDILMCNTQDEARHLIKGTKEFAASKRGLGV